MQSSVPFGGFEMIGDDPRIPDDVLLSALNGIFQAKSIRELQKHSTGALNFRYGSYHHLPAIGSHNFDQTNQHWVYNLPPKVTSYINKYGNRSDPVMKYVLKKARPFWTSQLLDINDHYDSLFIRRVELILNEISDGILMPVFGPNHRYGYIFISFHHPKEYYDEIFIWQLQTFLKASHVQYCILSESFKKAVHLTNRESQVLERITFGQTNQEIAKYLKISPNTVAGYVKQLYLKLDVTDRVQAAMKAHNYISLGGS